MTSRPPVVERSPCRLPSVLSSAVSEWLLMVLLFLNGFFTYMVTKFAHYCKLQTPCLFCSRLDHTLGSEKPGFYKNLFCDSHKLEISSWAYCHVHQKLADVREMCEACLLSFATEKKTNSETYRSLVGKLEIDLEKEERPETSESNWFQSKTQGEDVAQIPLLPMDHALDFHRKKCCSCCIEQLKTKSNILRLFETKSFGAEVSEPIVPVLALSGLEHPQTRNGLSKGQEICRKPPAVSHGGSHVFDCLEHIGYTELKVTSDSESEVPVSDDDDLNAFSRGSNDVKGESMSQSLQSDKMILQKTDSDVLAKEKLICIAPITPDPSAVILEKQICASEPYDATTHGLKELNWNEVGKGAHPAQSDILSHQVPTEATNSIIDVVKDGGILSSSVADQLSKALSSTESSLKPSQITNATVLPVPRPMDLTDAYKLILNNKGNEPSPRTSSRAQEDLRLMLSQISAARGLELPSNDMISSPRVHGIGEGSIIWDGSGSVESLNKRLSIERNESGFESSLDGSIIGEIEGESVVDRLKRQVELERKSLSLLYKELEEERNASSIAANQAMAMITRLQEEKAAMQMEALQYQRMIEEQVEYDQEALQNSNDILAERERQIQELEAELESYRQQFKEEYGDSETIRPMDNTDKIENTPISTPHVRQHMGDPKSVQAEMEKVTITEDFVLDFEDEKVFISECLKNLEKKLHLFSNKGVHVEISGLGARKDGIAENITENSQFPGTETSEKGNLQDHFDVVEKNTHIREDASSTKTDSNSPGENSYSKLKNNTEISRLENHSESSSLPNSSHVKQKSSDISKETDAVTLEMEISHLNERLKALEADHSFLEHTINSLRNGNEGLRIVKDIAYHLQELRKVGIRR